MSIRVSFPGAKLSLSKLVGDIEGADSQLRIAFPYGAFVIQKSQIRSVSTTEKNNCLDLYIHLNGHPQPLHLSFYNLSKKDSAFLKTICEVKKPNLSSELHLEAIPDEDDEKILFK